jgi:hypothetical protein
MIFFSIKSNPSCNLLVEAQPPDGQGTNGAKIRVRLGSFVPGTGNWAPGY